MGRYTIGRRRYSWEKRGGARPSPEDRSGGVGGFIVLIIMLYLVARPLFWIVMAGIGLILACLLVMGLASLAERISRSTRLFSKRTRE